MTTTDAYNELLRIQLLGIQILRADTTYRAIGAEPPAELTHAVAEGKRSLKSMRLRIETEQTRRQWIARQRGG